MAKIIFQSISKTLKKGLREKRKSELWDAGRPTLQHP